MINFMSLPVIVLLHLHLYIPLAAASTIKHTNHVGPNIAPDQAAPRTPMITTSIASHIINGLSGRAFELGNLLPRDDKMDDLFYSHESNALDGRKAESDARDDEDTGKAVRSKSSISRLPLGDFTKILELDQLQNAPDEPELVINNHHVTADANLTPVTSNPRHYNGHHLSLGTNALPPSSYNVNQQQHQHHHHHQHHHQHQHHGHKAHHYGKYSPNMFANNYNLNYIHSFLTSKPAMPSASLSIQTMQSLFNSNPNALTLSPYGSASAPSGGFHLPVSSTLSAASHQSPSANSIRGQPNHQYSPINDNVGQHNSSVVPTADYSNPTQCGRQQVAVREPRIVGGNNTYEGEFPWAVSIQRHGNHHCGGVIVGHRWILTAAHCVRSQLVGNLIVRTGGHTLTRSANSINAHLEKDFPVEQIIMHDDFSRYDNLTSSQMKSSANTNNADIALLKLKQQIHWNEHAWPVCFPNREAGNFSGHDAIVIGWGKLNEKSEEFSNELQKVKLTIIDNKVCQNWFRQAGRDMPIDDRIICAGFKNGGKDACHGDSGGPLLSRLNGQYVVVGVVSTGIGCARPLLPGLYSRVSSYIGWIEKYITI